MFYRDRKILVTGGTGFVGTHIVHELLKHKAKIRIALHNRPLLIKDDRIETIQSDLAEEKDCLAAVKGVDCVFHCAGSVGAAGITANAQMASITTNLFLTAQILQACWTENIDRILIFSSSTGYPVTAHPVKEEEFWNGPLHPSYFGYGWMRRYIERLSEFVASNSNVKIAIVRPTAIYGRSDNFNPRTSHVIPALIRKAVEKQEPFEVWGSGEEVRDFLHVEDLARSCLLMLEHYATCDPVNIGYGQVVTIKEIVYIILKAAEYEDARIVFNSSKPTAIPFRMVDTAKAKTILGFKPEISLEEGLKDTIEWYKKVIRGKLAS